MAVVVQLELKPRLGVAYLRVEEGERNEREQMEGIDLAAAEGGIELRSKGGEVTRVKWPEKVADVMVSA